MSAPRPTSASSSRTPRRTGSSSRSRRSGTSFLLSAPEFARYIDEFKSPWVGAYFDVGNVVEYGYPQEWIRELGPRILKVHIKEYAKPRRFDYLLGAGKEIDWPAVRKAFAEIGYRGWYTAEVPRGDLAAMKDVARRMDDLLGGG